MTHVKITASRKEVLPAYATAGAAGADLKADIASALTLNPGERRLISTGISIQLPAGYEAQVRPRSGLALKHGITVLNSPGTIDADYRGEIGVLLINLGTEAYTINPLERIAQMVVAPAAQATFTLTDRLDESLRGAGGYGHTGN